MTIEEQNAIVMLIQSERKPKSCDFGYNSGLDWASYCVRQSSAVSSSRHDEFIKGLDDMFDSIYDCEIDHPYFQETVGELMCEVVELYDKLHPTERSSNG